MANDILLEIARERIKARSVKVSKRPAILRDSWFILSPTQKVQRLIWVHGWLDKRAGRLSRLYQRRIAWELDNA